MDFDLNDDQRLLKDSVDRLIADRYGDFELRKGYRNEPHGWSPAVWADFASVGLTALPFSEEDGGIGGGPTETMIVMEAIGRGLAVEPYLSTVILAGTALRLGGHSAAMKSLVSEVASGALTMALAYTERQSRYDLFDVASTARPSSAGFVLEGRKSIVLHGDSAQKLIVSARTSGERRDKTGMTLFVVDAKAPGVDIHPYASQDGQRMAEVVLSGVTVGADAVLGEQDQGLTLLETVIDTGIAAIAAESIGAMESLQALTVDYLKTRKQFGVPLASFQALQHKAVDMMIAVEQARSMAMLAAMMVDAAPDERRAAISAAKVQINRSARFVGQQAVQLHGGIGVTLEYKAGHYFKRLTAIESQFGDTDHHLAAIDAAALLS